MVTGRIGMQEWRELGRQCWEFIWNQFEFEGDQISYFHPLSSNVCTPGTELVKSFNPVLVAYELHEIRRNYFSLTFIRITQYPIRWSDCKRVRLWRIVTMALRLASLDLDFRGALPRSCSCTSPWREGFPCQYPAYMTICITSQGSLFLFWTTSVSQLCSMQDI